MKRSCLRLLPAFAAVTAMASSADAAIVINVTQSGANVVASLTGSLSLTGLTALPTSFGLSKAVRGTSGYIGVGSATMTTGYTGVTGPGSFGPGTTFNNATSFSGDGFGLEAFTLSQALFLPVNYVSGSQLVGSATFANTTIAALGLATGQYVFQTTGNADSITVNIGAAAGGVPEPTSWSLMLFGFGLVGAALRSRSRLAEAAA